MSAHPLTGASLLLGKLLQIGIAAGSSLILVGAGLAVARGELVRGFGLGRPGLTGVGLELLHLDAAAFIRTGIFVLILTPVLRVIVSGFLLGRRGDRVAVVCTISVLLLLALAFALELKH